MVKGIFRKFTVFLLVTILVVALNGMTFADGTDVGKHWAKNEIEYLVSKKIMSGYNDGTFKPDKEITRAEFIKTINNVFGYTEKAQISFSDVKKSDWYYEDIQKGVAAGYIGGYSDGTMKPNKAISRQEAAKIIAVTYNLDKQNSTSANEFKDLDKIEDWAKNYIGIMKDNGFMSGYGDGNFGSKKNIARGEVAKILYTASGEIVNTSVEYKKDVDGNMIVNVSGAEIRNMTVKGDLYLAEGIGDGDVILSGVTVKGNVYVRGGGENSIKIVNSKINNVVVNKKSGNVRVVLRENSQVSNMNLDQNGALVVESGAKVENLKVNGESKIEVQKGGQIKELEVSAKNVEIKSEGTIEKLVAKEEVKVNDKVVEKNKEVKVKDGKVEIKGEEIKKETVQTPTTSSTGGGGGSSTGGSTGGGDTPIPSIVDKKSLNSKIAEAEKLRNIDYTEESWTNLQNVLNSAKEVAGKTDATQAEVDSALNNLVNAINGLVKATEVKAVLEFTPDEILNEGFKLGKAKVYVIGISNADKYSIKYSVKDDKGNVEYVKTKIAKIGEENPDLIQIAEDTKIEIFIYDFNNKEISSLSGDKIKVVVK